MQSRFDLGDFAQRYSCIDLHICECRYQIIISSIGPGPDNVVMGLLKGQFDFGNAQAFLLNVSLRSQVKGKLKVLNFSVDTCKILTHVCSSTKT